MTADEYWYGHPLLAAAYREANKVRLKKQNEFAHLQGYYINVGVSVALSNGFGKKGARKQDYPKEPFDLGLDTEMEKAFKAKREREKIVANLNAWKAAWDKQHELRGEQS